MNNSAPLLVLIGPPGSGKSRIGKRVAKMLGSEFIDTDRRIVAAHGRIAEIFEMHGEQYFRSIERAIVAEVLKERAVVSLGGGAVLDNETQRELADKRVVLLSVSAVAVAKRIGGTKRPLLAGTSASDRIEAWQRIADSRRRMYEKLAQRTWDTSRRPIDQLAREIADWVEHDTAGIESL